MTCAVCRDIGVNVAALPDVVDPKMTLRDAVGLFGVCPVCAVVSAAVCWNRGTDIGAEMIRQGLAMATPDAPFGYHALERIAMSNGFGVWGFGGKQVIVTQRNGIVVRKLVR